MRKPARPPRRSRSAKRSNAAIGARRRGAKGAFMPRPAPAQRLPDRPERMRKVRSQRAASAGSWVTSTRVEPLRALAANNSSMIAPPVASSRLPVGSSAITTDGRGASARASATRCCSPPESWAG